MKNMTRPILTVAAAAVAALLASCASPTETVGFAQQQNARYTPGPQATVRSDLIQSYSGWQP